MWPTCLAAKYSVASLQKSTGIIAYSRVNKDGAFDEVPLRLLAVIFFLIFRASKVLSVWSPVLFQAVRRKVVFLRQFFQAFFLLVLKGQTRCPKGYDSPRGLCKGQSYDFPRVTSLLRIQARLYRPPCFFFICGASRQPITSVEFKFVARQVVASVVIRAAKLKFVAENRTRIYFVQHAASTWQQQPHKLLALIIIVFK